MSDLQSEPLTTKRKAIVVFDIDGVVRDVGGSYRRALADTVEEFTLGAYRPSEVEIDQLKSEGIWNNDWEGSQELVYRYFEAQGGTRAEIALDYEILVAFFQSRYRGSDGENWNGYICTEPLLLEPAYLESLTTAGMVWGFFSGATRGSASYILEKRLGLETPVLVAMEDAPGKPDPTGLLATVALLEGDELEAPLRDRIDLTPVIYVGDTVADMYTVEKAKILEPQRTWIGVGVLPPHVQQTSERREAYEQLLKDAGAVVVFGNVQELGVKEIGELVRGDG